MSIEYKIITIIFTQNEEIETEDQGGGGGEGRNY